MSDQGSSYRTPSGGSPPPQFAPFANPQMAYAHPPHAPGPVYYLPVQHGQQPQFFTPTQQPQQYFPPPPEPQQYEREHQPSPSVASVEMPSVRSPAHMSDTSRR
jgi:hypothetical protein